jgi:hypothetical protein
MKVHQSQAAFESDLRELIPKKVSDFAKLEAGEPDHFDHWAQGHSGSACIY